MAITSLKITIRKFTGRDFLRALLILAVAGTAAALGALFGAYIAIKDNLPSITELENLKPKLITTVYAASGEPLKEFAEQRRIEVPYEKIPASPARARPSPVSGATWPPGRSSAPCFRPRD